jgi:hypothetical protein
MMIELVTSMYKNGHVYVKQLNIVEMSKPNKREVGIFYEVAYSYTLEYAADHRFDKVYLKRFLWN